jgi:hypothetical protein
MASFSWNETMLKSHFSRYSGRLPVKNGYSLPLRLCKIPVAAICGRHGGTKDKK